jgi:predicted DNA-binding WGR domain protein
LRDFGWRVAFVLAKDWYEDRAAVLDRLTRLLAGDEEPEEDEEQANEESPEAAQALEHFEDTPAALGVDPYVAQAAESEAAAAAGETPAPETGSSGQDPVAQPATPSEAAATGDGTRRFEFTGGNSQKFWEITLAGPQHTVRFGRVGSKGQTVTKTFDNTASARRDCERLIRSKMAKGYREIP